MTTITIKTRTEGTKTRIIKGYLISKENNKVYYIDSHSKLNAIDTHDYNIRMISITNQYGAIMYELNK